MKQIFKLISVLLLCALCLVACTEDAQLVLPENPNSGNTDSGDGNEDDSGEEPDNGEKPDNGEEPNPNEPPMYNDYPNTAWAVGELDWVFDMNELPEIRIFVSTEQWNELLKEYDRDNNTNHYIHCDVEYKSKGETHNFADAGLRLRGNTSRKRPEGNGGEMHRKDNTDWHHCHFMVNLRK